MWYPWTVDFDRSLNASELFRQLDRAFRFEAPWAREAEPASTLLETSEGYEFRLEVPGVSQKELTLEVNDQTLTLSAKREVKTREGWSTHRAERAGFAWKRSYTFPTKLDAERTKAKLELGVLTVNIAKAPELQPRRVQIGVS